MHQIFYEIVVNSYIAKNIICTYTLHVRCHKIIQIIQYLVESQSRKPACIFIEQEISIKYRSKTTAAQDQTNIYTYDYILQ